MPASPPVSLHSPQPAAIVLCSVLTGLATVRALAMHGIQVHALVFDPQDPLRLSRYPSKVTTVSATISEHDLTDLVCRCAQSIGGQPVLLVTSDAHALWLARHASVLKQACRLWTTPYATVNAIIRKESLYELAGNHGVPVVPWTRCDDLDKVRAWSAQHAGPYLIKPSFCADQKPAVLDKNKFCPDRPSLLGFLQSCDSSSFLVQRLIAGGDGEIFDTYGLCNRDGEVRSISTHRRWRQYPPNLGTTTFGEIPANAGQGDDIIITQTFALLSQLRYHGIFGIEWLRDRETGHYYLIDFNARPFSSIGHLRDCGVNLPLLGYRDLIGENLADEPVFPAVQHRYWVNLHRDIRARRSPQAALHPAITPPACPPLWQVRSFAYLDWRDPGPLIQKLAETMGSILRFALASVRNRACRVSPKKLSPKPTNQHG